MLIKSISKLMPEKGVFCPKSGYNWMIMRLFIFETLKCPNMRKMDEFDKIFLE